MTMRNRIAISAMLITLALCANGCGDEGEEERFQELENLQAQAQAIDIRSSPEAALSAYQEALDATNRFLDEYPSGQHAAALREKREKLTAKLNSLREEYFEYQRVKTQQMDQSQPQLPSDCAKMVKLWDGYITRFPNSAFVGLARESRRRWEAKQQEEMKRGFYIILDEGEVSRVKGSSHGMMAGHPWDPQFFGAQSAPDPYAVIEIGGQVIGYCPVAKDSFHPVWHRKVDAQDVSDEQNITITMRERDVAEKAVVALLGKDLFTFTGITAATEVLKKDNDDDIGRWSGSIRQLLEASKNGPVQIGDSARLRVKVIRP